MTCLPSSIQPRLGSLLRLLGSPVDGEALGAARAIGRTLTGAGVDFHALADVVERPPAPMVIYRTEPTPARPSWREYAYEQRSGSSHEWSSARKREVRGVLQRSLGLGLMTKWEEDFVYSIMHRLYDTCGGGRLSEKQVAIVDRLLRKIGASR